MMADLWSCFGKVLKTNKLQFCQDGKFTLKGGNKGSIYTTTILSKNNENLVVFDVGDNSHASFVADGYNSNCDYIFIQINSKDISFILCELKTSNKGKTFKQLKCSIPLMHYLKQLLITHCGEGLKDLKIKHRKVLIIKDQSQKTTIKNKPEIDNDNGVGIFYGEEFSSNEIFNQ
ncbi:MAG: hypothetical protein HRO68_09845 [Nitrosopumilus sp.]|nr:hypothetical protein [Nitrosopumilus sp.]